MDIGIYITNPMDVQVTPPSPIQLVESLYSATILPLTCRIDRTPPFSRAMPARVTHSLPPPSGRTRGLHLAGRAVKAARMDEAMWSGIVVGDVAFFLISFCFLFYQCCVYRLSIASTRHSTPKLTALERRTHTHTHTHTHTVCRPTNTISSI